MPSEKIEQQAHGFSPNARVISLDAEAIETAAALVESFLDARASGHATCRLEYLGSGATLIKTDALISAMGLLVADHRHHRPTQWAYEQACRAIDKHRVRADIAESDVRDLAEHLGRLLGENPSQADRDAAREYFGQLVHRAAKEN